MQLLKTARHHTSAWSPHPPNTIPAWGSGLLFLNIWPLKSILLFFLPGCYQLEGRREVGGERAVTGRQYLCSEHTILLRGGPEAVPLPQASRLLTGSCRLADSHALGMCLRAC